ncbi:hypothetical protein SDC9_130209 [bioreactor metagenome]|uniref:Uncharacterized protein n=1 Tax=bioreactor metagenome TaxID=1076179 RepID=A0A645D147_9ZZZZ
MSAASVGEAKPSGWGAVRTVAAGTPLRKRQYRVFPMASMLSSARLPSRFRWRVSSLTHTSAMRQASGSLTGFLGEGSCVAPPSCLAESRESGNPPLCSKSWRNVLWEERCSMYQARSLPARLSSGPSDWSSSSLQSISSVIPAQKS